MGDRIKTEQKGNNIDITCKICGNPIIKSSFYGIYCENGCGLEEDKKSFGDLQKIFGQELFKSE